MLHDQDVVPDARVNGSNAYQFECGRNCVEDSCIATSRVNPKNHFTHFIMQFLTQEVRLEKIFFKSL